MAHIVITGCAGFIGARVAEMLLERGDRVTGLDNLNDYYDPALKRWRLDRLRGREGFRFEEMDIAEMGRLREALGDGGADAVVNLAARAGVRASLEDPWVYLETNARGTLNLLEWAREEGVPRMVLASTSSLYGTNEMPFRETQSTDRPLAPYAATKKAAEALCYSYHYNYGIHVAVPRYFTVYGPAGRPDMSYFRFIRYIDEGRAIPVFGDGKQLRDFTYIDDIAAGTLRCLGVEGYEVVNLGSDRPVELMRMIGLIEEALGRKAEIEWLPRHPADVPATWADLGKARELLGWEPATGIEEGMGRAVEWYREHRELVRGLRD